MIRIRRVGWYRLFVPSSGLANACLSAVRSINRAGPAVETAGVSAAVRSTSRPGALPAAGAFTATPPSDPQPGRPFRPEPAPAGRDGRSRTRRRRLGRSAHGPALPGSDTARAPRRAGVERGRAGGCRQPRRPGFRWTTSAGTSWPAGDSRRAGPVETGTQKRVSLSRPLAGAACSSSQTGGAIPRHRPNPWRRRTPARAITNSSAPTPGLIDSRRNLSRRGGGSTRCRRGDLNPHALAGTSPSS